MPTRMGWSLFEWWNLSPLLVFLKEIVLDILVRPTCVKRFLKKNIKQGGLLKLSVTLMRYRNLMLIFSYLHSTYIPCYRYYLVLKK